jgi:carboxypeptidase Taq
LGRDDVRITTRFEENYFPSSIFSTIHETGHAFYELGMNPHPDYRHTRLADASSTGIHESQSRTWENIIGRSLPFWKCHYSAISAASEGVLSGVPVESFVRGVNKVETSLIRTEADEVTYGLHIIARFELESALVSGNLAVKDVPKAWNDAYKTMLGLDVPSDSLGCLQDIHWSMGAFGYFPSYALGNLYAAQFWSAMARDIPDIEARLEQGDYATPLEWLGRKIHRCGAMYLPGELVRKVTGEPLDPNYFARYLNEKYGRIYGF